MYDLGLTSKVAMSLTPGQLTALSERHQLSNYFSDRRAGIIASTIANVNRGKGKKAYKPEDFMPKYNLIEDNTAMTPEQMERAFELMATVHNERLKRLG